MCNKLNVFWEKKKKRRCGHLLIAAPTETEIVIHDEL